MPVLNGNVTQWLMGGFAAYDNCVFFGKGGHDANGDGTYLAPYLTCQAAFDAVTENRKIVVAGPGRHSTAASITWPDDVSDILLTGITSDSESTCLHCTSGAQVLEIAPGATIGANNFLAFSANMCFSGAGGINGVQITNTDMTTGKKLIATFRDCMWLNDVDTDKSINITHTKTDALMKTYIHGRGFGGNNIEGLVFVDHANAGDRFKANGMNFEGGIEFSTDAIASESGFYACIMKLDGGAGGGVGQLINSYGCASRDHMAQATAAQGDFEAATTTTFLSLDFA